MKPIPVIAIFDIGKTNKKLFLFDEDYKIVYEKSAKFNEMVDEDGFPCENLEALTSSMFESLREVLALNEYDIRAINFSTYGASFVYIDEDGRPLTPLYNYLKPYPESLKEKFYASYGGEYGFARKAASPILGSLNSGMQLYRLKQEQPQVFAQTKYALHLPQYMSFLLTGKPSSDITSIGCHTNLWDFDNDQYHEWVNNEYVGTKLAPLQKVDSITQIERDGKSMAVGFGLHDSSSALIPYLANFQMPFMLLSTGTWCISLNPFNNTPLTADELRQDCLCYMDYRGKHIKAARLFAGYEHEQQTKRLSSQFKQYAGKYKSVEYAPDIISTLKEDDRKMRGDDLMPFADVNLDWYEYDEAAYHHLIYDLVRRQVASSNLVLKNTAVKRVFVDGGFSKNGVYMNMLAAALPGMEVFAAFMPQATSLGAAIALHHHWNPKSLPVNLIELNYYAFNSYIKIR
jgi:sugar (pentulose or hexulose) kinase